MSDVPPIPGKDTFTRERMQKIARLVDEELPHKWGFIVIAMPFGAEDGRVNYVSNAKREDVVVMLSNFLAQTRRGDFGSHTDKVV